MIDHSLSIIMMDATRASYGDLPISPTTGYILDDNFVGPGEGSTIDDPTTGFSATAFKNDDGEYIIAFRGTEDLQDWNANLQLGWPQWEANRERIQTYINEIIEIDPDATIHFTGHSLGGGNRKGSGLES